MKTKEDILKELQEVEEHIFLIDMVDRWQDGEAKVWEELNQKKQKLKEELEIIENERK